MRVAMGYATATLALTFCRCSSTAASTAASSASRSSGKAAEALAGPAQRQRAVSPRADRRHGLTHHSPCPVMRAQSSGPFLSFGSPARQLLKPGASPATHRPHPSSSPPLVSFW